MKHIYKSNYSDTARNKTELLVGDSFLDAIESPVSQPEDGAGHQSNM